ncbi:HAD family hydrolase [Microlunatus soli]|uniref:Haloacid dehalogenase superfamily, subfamily IA, variant 3 with third motif having DD or ED n=1 Tax=Microlunatus soli TaxID=630515 RepID=A0A1H1ZTG1_9ACTN|nr:HAD family phosphatase [Microlunatus soli]SDT36940.1 haloacid dehalogenase superfamily, subfamily IA, variant 3 with third motif having DD or ED [Microlunatus soli]
MQGDPIGAVLFDMDGTLFDSERLWDVSLEELATGLGGTLSPAARLAVVGSNLIDTVRMVHADVGVDGDHLQSARWLLQRTRELFAEGVPWRPGAEQLLDAVRSAGVPTALVTGSYRSLVEVVLGQLAPDTFDVVVCGDEVTKPKPDPEPYLAAAATLDLDPRRCVALEDSANGIASATAAGCLVVAVPEDPLTLPDGHTAIVAELDGLTVDRLGDWLAASTLRSETLR